MHPASNKITILVPSSGNESQYVPRFSLELTLGSLQAVPSDGSLTIPATFAYSNLEKLLAGGSFKGAVEGGKKVTITLSNEATNANIKSDFTDDEGKSLTLLGQFEGTFEPLTKSDHP